MSTVLLLNGDVSGGAAIDSTGRHVVITNDGTITSSGGMLSFNGSTALRIDDNLSDFVFPGALTFEGQMNSPTLTATTAIIMSNYVGVAGDVQLFTRGAPNYQGGIFSTAGPYLEPSTPPWVTDSIRDFAFTYDADPTTPTSRLYLAGTLIASVVGVANFAPGSLLSLFIGRESAGVAKFFNGLLRLRIDNGVALYTGSSYTPPSWPISIGISPTGIASAEAFGTPAAASRVSPAGIASAQALGAPAVSARISSSGIVSGEAFGVPSAGGSIAASGISSAQAFGIPEVNGIHLFPVGIASAEAAGQPSLAARILAASLATGEQIGRPTVGTVQVLGSLIGRTRQAFGIRTSVQTATRSNTQTSRR